MKKIFTSFILSILASGALFVMPSLALDKDWVQVCANTYVKKSSLATKPFKKSKALVRFYHDKYFSKINGKYVKYSDNYMYINCRKDPSFHLIALKYVENYDKKNNLINRVDIKQFNKRYMPFSPKSKGRFIRDYVCKATRG